jgi:CBS domain-containing protein
MADPHNPVRDVMSHGAISVDEKVTLRSLAAVLSELDIGAALVAAPDGSVGIASERDIVRALADGADPDDVWAADISSDDMVSVEPDDTVLAAAEQMTSAAVRHLPVVRRGTIVGVVSVHDVLPLLSEYARATLPQ